MKGTEKIIAHIQADAKAEADEILSKAEQECAEIRRQFEEKAKEAYAVKIREGVKLCEENADSKERIAVMENKKEILAMKQRLLSECFEKAKEKLLAMPEENYARFLVKLAVKSAGDGSGEIILNPVDREKYGEAIVQVANAMLGNGRLTLSEESGDFSGGLILRNGQIEINNTVDLLIGMSREEMAGQVAGILFG